MKITRRDVQALRDEAAASGDAAMIEICDLALSDESRVEYNRGDARFEDEPSHAWRRCLNAVEYAAGQELKR